VWSWTPLSHAGLLRPPTINLANDKGFGAIARCSIPLIETCPAPFRDSRSGWQSDEVEADAAGPHQHHG
jgi:hypothetical protein